MGGPKRLENALAVVAQRPLLRLVVVVAWLVAIGVGSHFFMQLKTLLTSEVDPPHGTDSYEAKKAEDAQPFVQSVTLTVIVSSNDDKPLVLLPSSE